VFLLERKLRPKKPPKLKEIFLSIKILGGLAKGQALFIPPSESTRPTSVMLRRKAFDAVQDLSGLHFYDFCAGSAAMGIEAWSRGAESVTLIESSSRAQQIIKKNLSALKNRYATELEQRPIHLYQGKVEQWTKISSPKSDCILFFDPPYKDHTLYKSFKDFIGVCEVDAEVWVESDKLSGVALSFFADWQAPYKVYEHSNSWLARWKIPFSK